MAHIPDGLLSAPVLVVGGLLAAGGIALGLRRMDDRAIPRVALVATVFFTASLIAIPVGPSSVHLLLSALMGLVLGPGIFPATFVALALQALLFGFGGLTTLGVNTVNIALPGYLAALLLGPWLRRCDRVPAAAVAGGLAAALAVAGTAALVSLTLAVSAPEFTPVARIVALTYLPLALGEALVCAAIVAFLKRAGPELLLPRLETERPS